jgi:hypothetical protein
MYFSMNLKKHFKLKSAFWFACAGDFVEGLTKFCPMKLKVRKS